MATVYFDTSVLSALFDPRNPNRLNDTKEWFDTQRKKHDCYISEVVIAEIDKNEPLLRAQITNTIKDIPLLPPAEGVKRLADLVLQKKLLPPKSTADALHLSYAIVYEIDFLLSWNFKHLANDHRQRLLNRFSIEHGLFIPKLVPPIYLF